MANAAIAAGSPARVRAAAVYTGPSGSMQQHIKTLLCVVVVAVRFGKIY